MKTRLSKKGLTARELVIFILAVGVLVLMFWGPLGTWWSNLSKKYNLFEKSVDARLQNLELFGPGSVKQEDLNYIAQKGSLEEIKKTLEFYKKDLENKCVEDTGFKTYVERVETSGIGTDVSSDPQKWDEYLNFMKFACDRLYNCLKDDKKTEEQILNNFIYFANKCKTDKRLSEFIQTISGIINNGKVGYSWNSWCDKLSREGLSAFQYFPICKNKLIKQIDFKCSELKVTLFKEGINKVLLEFTYLSADNKIVSDFITINCINLECIHKYPQLRPIIPALYNYRITAEFKGILDIASGVLDCLNQKP